MPTGFRLERLSRRNPDQHLPKSDNLADAEASRYCFLTTKCRKEFLRTSWQLQLDTVNGLDAYQSYFRNYEESCLYLATSHPLLEQCTHKTFCEAVQHLKPGNRKSCEANIMQILPPTSRSPEAARECINFIGKAILLIDLSEWRVDQTLRDFMEHTVAFSSTQTDHYRIPLSFNARAFEQVADIKILWTRDLLSHLEVGLNDSTLSLFHNVQVLHLYEQLSLREIFPDNFLDETRRTLSLMLPVADRASLKWFNSKQRRFGLDPAAGDCQHLRATQRNIQDFDFWRDRLIVAREAFDLSQPRGLLYFWRDDRNKVQWWTFWIAITVFLLTLVGVIESALQVYKAYHPS
jgi:hypothetical protein